MIRFLVHFGKLSEQSCPNSNDVKSLFEVYGTVEYCEVVRYRNGSGYVFAIVGIRDCKIPSKEIAAQLDKVVCKGVPARVCLVKKSKMCPTLAKKGHCPYGCACKFAHTESELKNEVKEAAAGDSHEMIQKPTTDAGAFKQQTLQLEIEDFKEEIANLKQEVLKEKQRSNDLAVQIEDFKEEIANLKQEDYAWQLVGEMSLQIVQLTKELLKVQTGATDAKESIPGPIDSLGPHRSPAPAEPTQRMPRPRLPPPAPQRFMPRGVGQQITPRSYAPGRGKPLQKKVRPETSVKICFENVFGFK